MERGSFRPLAAFITLIAIVCAPSVLAAGDESSFSDAHAAMGKKNVVRYDLGPTPQGEDEDSTGLLAVLNAMILGQDRSILEAQASVTSALEGESDFYWGGFRVWSSKPEWKDGAFQIAAGLPTISMRAPLVAVPVGPVTLRVDAGVAAEAEVAAKLRPLLSIPVQFTQIQAELAPKLSASAFVEGYAKWIAIRAGVGGELELARADATVSGRVGLGGIPPVLAFNGFVSLLAGRIYAFVDYFNVFKWKWKRALEPRLADWEGKCFDFRPNGGRACAD
jgi:hypothetical protein